MEVKFFVPMIPPTCTQQEHQVRIHGGKPQFYEPTEVKAARSKLGDAVGPYRPPVPMNGAVRLMVKWCFPCGDSHDDGEYRITKPDTDNLQKMLKDVMESKHWTCERCGHRAEIVHHKKHLNDTNVNDPALALGWDNLQALCIPCHNAAHGCGSGVPDGFTFDADGNLIKRSR